VSLLMVETRESLLSGYDCRNRIVERCNVAIMEAVMIPCLKQRPVFLRVPHLAEKGCEVIGQVLSWVCLLDLNCFEHEPFDSLEHFPSLERMIM